MNDPEEERDDEKKELLDKSNSGEDAKLSHREDRESLRDDLIAERNYVPMVVKLSVQWTTSSFGNYLLLYLNKYLSGTIYINYYYDGLSGIIGFFIGKFLYSNCRLKISFIVSYIISIIGGLGIFLFEAEIISPYAFGDDPSPYPHGSKKDKEWHLAKIVPWFTLIAKIGATITCSNAFQATFGDPKVFPNLKRATAAGICNFVARFATIFAPLVAELDRPAPIYIFLVINTIGFLVSLTFPSTSETKALE